MWLNLVRASVWGTEECRFESGHPDQVTYAMRRALWLLPVVLLAACAPSRPVPGVGPSQAPTDAGDESADSGDASDACRPAAVECQIGHWRRCGRADDGCGTKRECGSCPEPYACDTQDLQDFEKSGWCGLRCRNEPGPTPSCPNGGYPVLFFCENTPGLMDLLASEDFDRRYSCYLSARTTAEELAFCCGF